jgi:hypothetical protein
MFGKRHLKLHKNNNTQTNKNRTNVIENVFELFLFISVQILFS